MEKLYKYVGITVVGLVVLIIIINLFHLNTKVIGLTVKKEQKKRRKRIEKQQGTPLENLKITKVINDNAIKIWMIRNN